MKKAAFLPLMLALSLLLGGSASDQISGETRRLIRENGLDAALIVTSLNGENEYTINPERVEQQFLPASTFKILNTLIALKEGVIEDENSLLPWDGKDKGLAAWNKDQTLKSAFQSSCIWYYQTLAREVGLEKYAGYLKTLPYGNGGTGKQADTFWLEGDLRISAREQTGFLKNIYLETYDFDKADYKTLKDIMVEEKTPAYTLRAKTGLVQRVSPQTGWYVGYVETAEDVWFFACNLTIQKSTDADFRKRLVLSYLKELQII